MMQQHTGFPHFRAFGTNENRGAIFRVVEDADPYGQLRDAVRMTQQLKSATGEIATAASRLAMTKRVLRSSQ